MEEKLEVVHGIGPKTQKNLNDKGFYAISQLFQGLEERNMEEEECVKWLISIGVFKNFAKKCYGDLKVLYEEKKEEEESISDETNQIDSESEMFLFAHFNVRSLNKHKNELKDYLRDNHFDCIGLTETWLNLKQEGEITIPKFTFASNYIRKKKKRGAGGSSTLHTNNYTSRIREDLQELACDLHFECSCIEITELHLVVVTIYRSSTYSKDYKIFFDQLEKLLEKIGKQQALVCGDFNYDMLKRTANPKKLIEIFNKHGMKPAIKNQPTRETRTTSTLLDNIFSNIGPFTSEVLGIKFSDHSGQLIKLNVSNILKRVVK